jgi:hypothetical protein
VGKPEGKRPLERSRRRCVDVIKMDLREIKWDGMDWIDVAQDGGQVVGYYERSIEPSGCIKCCEVVEWLHNWRLLKKASAS